MDTNLVNKVLYATQDPQYVINGKSVPAMTSLLYRVCESDPDRFLEVMRIVELFIQQALKEGVRA